MKKYLTIAAVLGVIAFASVSLIAQADQQPARTILAKQNTAADPAQDPSDGEAAADKADASVAPAVPESTDADTKFNRDDGECADQSEAADKDGNPPTDTQKNTAYRKCMQMKGHSAAEMKKNGVDLTNKSDKPDAKDKDAPADE